MKRHKTIGILLSALAIAWVLTGCSSSDATVEPTLSDKQPLNTPIPALQPTDAPILTIVPTPSGPIEGQHAGQPVTPIRTNLLMSHVPLLQESVVLTLTVTATSDASDITAAINLPSGATLLSGEPTWQGALQAGQSQTLTVEIAFHAEGDWPLEGKALSPQPNGDVWGDASYIYLHVAEDGSHLGYEPDNNFSDDDPLDAPPPAVDPAPSSP